MGLLNEIDESLRLYESLEERLVLSHVLNIVLKVKNIICTVATEAPVVREAFVFAKIIQRITKVS